MTLMLLQPVVRFDPFDYKRSERESPPFGASSAEAETYWRACLADSGLAIAPIATGSWHIAVERIVGQSALAVMLEVYCRNIFFESVTSREEAFSSKENIDEFVPALLGGFALLRCGKLILEPSCCCGLETLRDWKKAGDHQAQSWLEIWSGHDGYEARVQSLDATLLRVEVSGREVTSVCFEVPSNVFRNAVAAAGLELESLAERLLPIIRSTSRTPFAEDVAAKMSGSCVDV